MKWHEKWKRLFVSKKSVFKKAKANKQIIADLKNEGVYDLTKVVNITLCNEERENIK